jgi:pyridoxal phosphate enzyme (YggS family)
VSRDLAAGIRARHAEVMERIARAAARAGREVSAVRLVAVTKAQPIETVAAALEAGLTRLGENYVEEALAKIAALGPGPEWHMIGHVQRRKAREAATHFALVHSVDSLALAQRLDRMSGERGRRLPVLLECNVSGEASKFGFPARTAGERSAMAAEVNEILRLPNLTVQGLMTVAPLGPTAELARPVFAGLRGLRDGLCSELGQPSWPELSMGMSDDFEVAVEEGATLVRIGRAVLGERPSR